MGKAVVKVAFKRLNSDGKWIIFFNPKKKLDGEMHYDQISGYIDEEVAEYMVQKLKERE